MIVSNKLEWATNYPKNDDINRTCIAWSGQGNNLKIMNTKCDSSEDASNSGLKTYYDGKSGQKFDKTLLQRGYLCETKAIHTIAAYDRQVISPTNFQLLDFSIS